jgi:glutamine amidotransferase/cyclase
MTLTVIDYGAGNLRSVANALKYIGCSFEVCDKPSALEQSDRIVLPGVGHFGAAMNELARRGLTDPLIRRVRAGAALLGICLGLQLLFESSDEAPGVAGLGLLRGTVRRLRTRVVPHIGWNRLDLRRASPLTAGLPDSVHCYFANSYAAAPANDDVVIAATSQDDETFPAIVGRDRVQATQFHPEKSGPAGLTLLRNFARC